MLTTTVKVILQQVQDTVEKRMCARVCVDNCHDRNHEISGVDSVHCSLNPRTLISDRSSDTGDGKGYNGGLIVGATSAAQPPALRTATLTDRWRDEGLCLCLQDKDGVYHWVGGTHHFHEVTVLRAPFIAEACLRSHAVFEEERRRRCRQARQQLSSSMRSSSLSSSALASESSLLSRFNRNAEDTRPVRKSRECSNGRSDRRAEKRGARPAGVSESTTAPSTTATVAYKHDAADMLAGQAFAQKASGLRFAFLKGVVVPMVVLRQYNPHHVMVSKHHPHDQTPWQYAEVRVPADMQVEPLDGSSFSSVATEFCGTAQASVKEAAVEAFTHAEPLAPRVAVVPNSDRPGNTALQSPPSSNSTKTPAKRDFEGEVRSLTTAWMPASSSVLSVSSAWTLASRSSLPNESCEATADADGPSAHAMVFDTQQCRSNHSMEAAAANTAAAAGPVGLVMPTTTVERASEVNNPCAMTGALRARGIIHRQARATLAAEEDAACTALATAQRDYAAALAEYKAAVLYSRAEPTAVDECGVQVSQPTPFPDAELTFLLQRKMEVQRRLEVYWQAEQQCERLTTLTECLEKELREQEERRELLTQPLRHRNDSAAFATGC
ncbi:hypothetical protein MNV84_02441 [Leishmania braziliensis]|nr:hypothetical protein MNV84_02441 [Leishmania braziliensis]